MIERFLIWINKDGVPVTVVDRILEVIALVLTLVLIAAFIVFYVHAPEQVPSRFSLSGEVTSWGTKETCFIFMVSGILGSFLCLLAAYNYKYIHIPVRIRPECRMRQLMLMGRMSRILAVLLNLLFLSVLFSMTVVCFGLDCAWHGVVSEIVAVLVFVDVIVYTVWINWIGKRR